MVIDTGFTSFLSLPLSAITNLGLPWHYRDVGTLGDGSEVVFEIYKAAVIWDGQNQIVDVAASDADPLVGMGMLYGFKVRIEAVEGGAVTIEALK
jgi:clan AA aspartic protease